LPLRSLSLGTTVASVGYGNGGVALCGYGGISMSSACLNAESGATLLGRTTRRAAAGLAARLATAARVAIRADRGAHLLSVEQFRTCRGDGRNHESHLARLQAVRTTFMDLTQLAYRKRTSFGLVTNKVQKYRCIV
jgi:hypothetical protein